ncbi:MAG: translocation/assembly module TamB, partial [Acidobacteriaceae bacterium]|nr:translocation/assembly module TamB [Acidobacteriaceae bacterium]
MSKMELKDKLHEAEQKLEHGVKLIGAKIVKAERSLAARITRGMAIAILVAVLLIAALVGAVTWYTTTADFEHRISALVVRTLEDATGGRVELKALHFRLWHLAMDAQGLVIHGLEPSGEAPYLAVDRVQAHVRVFNFFGHASGLVPSPRVSLNYLRVDHPQFHLLIDKDGKTNQPLPKHPRTSTTPLMDTLLDLKAKQVEVANGVAQINNRAVPFEVAARDVDAEIHYIARSDRYGVTVDLKDLRTRFKQEPEAQSRLHLVTEIGRNTAELTSLDLHTGKASDLHVTATLTNFADPDWQAQARGALEVNQLAVLTSVDGLKAGTVDLDVTGHNCSAASAPEPKRSRLWSRLHLRRQDQPQLQPSSPECVSGYLIAGVAKLRGVTYRDEDVRLHDIDGSARLHIMPSEILLTEMSANLPGGGNVAGDMRIANSHTAIKATLARVPLRTIMDITAPENYGDLGFDTAVTGPVTVEYGNSGRRAADTVEVDGNFTLAPTGARRGRSNVPFAGRIAAHYTGRNDTVRIQQFAMQSPESSINADGVLGVSSGDRLTALNAGLEIRDLSEYDQLLTTLGLEANGKRGVAAIPVVLHGALEFHGSASGPADDLDVRGHVEASQIEFAMGSTDALIDSLAGDAEYSPNEGVTVTHSMIRRGHAALNVTGWLRPRKEVSVRGVDSYVWDNGMSMDAKAQLAEGSLSDVLQILGQHEIPVTGAIVANAHVTGTLQNMHGAGRIALKNGVAYGEPYDSAVADLSVTGREIDATHAVVKLHGAEITANGGYDFASERLHGHVEADKLVLSRFETVKKQLGQRVHADGILSLTADANGTLQEPNLRASVRLAGVSFEGHPAGETTAELHTAGKVLYAAVSSSLFSAKSDLAAQVELAGDYQTQAKLTIASFDVNRLLEVVAPDRVAAQSSISGTASISGPLRTPKNLSGVAEFNDIHVTLQQQLEMTAAEPLRLSLRDGVATLEQLHITGQDTDMRVSGTAQLFGAATPRGGKLGKLNLKANGSVSMSLLHMF